LPIEPPIRRGVDPALVSELPEMTAHPADDADPAGLLRGPRVQRALAAPVASPPAFRPLRRAMAGTPAGNALHGPLLNDVLPDEIPNPVPRDGVEDVVLDLRVRGDPHPVDPDAHDRRGEAPLVVEPHS